MRTVVRNRHAYWITDLSKNEVTKARLFTLPDLSGQDEHYFVPHKLELGAFKIRHQVLHNVNM